MWKVRGQAVNQFPKFTRQFPETALATTVSSSTPFFSKLLLVLCHFVYLSIERNAGAVSQVLSVQSQNAKEKQKNNFTLPNPSIL